MRTVEASTAAVIASMLPLVVAALGRIFLGERLPALAVAGLVAGAIGVMVIMQARLGRGADVQGLVLCGLGVLALAVATLAVRGASDGGNLWMVVGMQMLVGSAALLPASALVETWAVNWTAPMLLAFTYTTLVPGLAATMVWFVLVGRIGATRASTFHFLNPFLGVAIASFILGETVTGRDLLGVAVIMLGILAVQIARRPPRMPDVTGSMISPDRDASPTARLVPHGVASRRTSPTGATPIHWITADPARISPSRYR